MNCGYKDNADHVASVNILSRGYLPSGRREVTPVEIGRGLSLKQEPTGNREGVLLLHPVTV